MRHADPVVFPVDFDGGEFVPSVFNWWHILWQCRRCDSGSESLQVKTQATWHLVLSCWKMWSTFWSWILSSYGIQCSLSNFELIATIMTNTSPDHNSFASKTVGLVHTLVVKRSPWLLYTRKRSSLKRSENQDSSLKMVCCHRTPSSESRFT